MLEVKIHEVDGIEKLLISIEESGREFGEKLSISIYKEEVDLLSKFLETVKEYIDKRP